MERTRKGKGTFVLGGSRLTADKVCMKSITGPAPFHFLSIPFYVQSMSMSFPFPFHSPSILLPFPFHFLPIPFISFPFPLNVLSTSFPFSFHFLSFYISFLFPFHISFPVPFHSRFKVSGSSRNQTNSRNINHVFLILIFCSMNEKNGWQISHVIPFFKTAGKPVMFLFLFLFFH